MQPKINDVVQLKAALPGESLKEGAWGVVVAEFSVPEEAYEVEFTNADGETIAQLTLRPSQFALVGGSNGA
jgi:hypothetical protein